MPSSTAMLPVPALAALLLLAACGKPAPTSYRIPKESRPPAEFATPDAAAETAPSSMQILPGMAEAAEASGEIAYALPEGWTELAPQGIRKANLRVQDARGSAEITVLVFPGSVGGAAANINRWRQQIGLEPGTETAGLGTERTIAGHGALYVRLEGEAQSILGAILPFHGETWFFKMQGDSATVLAQETAMQAFLDSIQMPTHSH